MAQTDLLTIKFFRPAPSVKRVARKRLIQYLNDGLAAGHLLTLVSAPAGYGKSTLVSDWIDQLSLPVSWLSLDEADDDPLRFFIYFIAALQQVEQAVGRDLLAVLHAGQVPPGEVVVNVLANDLQGVKTDFVCVLDDFHVIQDSTIINVFQELFKHQPGALHLVIITREDPALPLPRLRAHNLLSEVRAQQLRFSQEEIDCFMRDVMELSLSDLDIARLEERTEGWVVGLQLAGLSMKGHASPSDFVATLSGEHRFILSYLLEEVLRSQPPDIQDFLLQTSILAELQGGLCDAVTGRMDSAALLERLLSANLFIIPLDEERRWYRYHHLFAELLCGQLRRAYPHLVSELHQRASRWYEVQGMLIEAIEHALNAGEYGRVVGLLEGHIWQLLNQGHARRIESWMCTLPVEWQKHSQRTNLGFAWNHLLRGNLAQAAFHLNQVEDALGQFQPVGEEATAMRAECLALRANLMQTQGNIAEAIEAAQHALELVKVDDRRIVGLAYLGLGGAYRQAVDFDRALEALQQALRVSRDSTEPTTHMLAASHLTLMNLQHGRLRFAAEVAAQSLAWLEQTEMAAAPIVGSVYGALGLIYYHWNQLEKADEYLHRGIKLGRYSGHNASLVYCLISRACLLRAKGDLEAAENTMAEAIDLAQQGVPAWVCPGLLAERVNLFLAQGRLMEAEAVLRQSGVAAQDEVTYQTDEIHLAHLRFLYQQGDSFQQAAALATRILASAEHCGRKGIALQTLLVGALIQAAGGDEANGLAWLERALQLAEPEGYIRVFIDEGEPMAALFRRLRHSAYVQRLLAQFPAPPREKEPLQKQLALGESLVEPLSERELEVLHRLAEGLTYAQIAAKLVVSINTVRFHVKRIYGKLGVSKQTQAAEKARQLGLLD